MGQSFDAKLVSALQETLLHIIISVHPSLMATGNPAMD